MVWERKRFQMSQDKSKYREEAESLLGKEVIETTEDKVLFDKTIYNNNPVEVLAKVLEEKADCEGCREKTYDPENKDLPITDIDDPRLNRAREFYMSTSKGFLVVINDLLNRIDELHNLVYGEGER
jgi:hypothetical protein